MLMKQQSGTKRDFSGENEHDDITIALEISDDEEEEIEASLDLNWSRDTFALHSSRQYKGAFS